MVVETSKFKEAEKIIKNVLASGRGTILPGEVLGIIKSSGISTLDYVMAKTAKEAIEASRTIGFPVVLKIVSPDVLHKSDVGGVVVGVESEEKVEKRYDEIMDNLAKNIPDACITGILVQKQVRQATEVIIGGIRDEQFGPAVMFGLGGVLVELFKDVAFRIAPVTEKEALGMMKQIKGYPILSGYRGMKELDISRITKTIVTVSELISSIDEIKEIELNPLFVYEKSVVAVDARIIIK
jgi:acetyl-CoA synthetase (ADP-forming)